MDHFNSQMLNPKIFHCCG